MEAEPLMHSNLEAAVLFALAPILIGPPADGPRWSPDAEFRTAPAAGAGGLDGPRLYPGAIELGLGGSITSVEGNTQAAVELRFGSFSATNGVLVGYEVQTSYAHVSALDVLGLEAALSWQRPVGSGGSYAFVAGAGGVRQEWLGSFRQARYPIGVDVGLRTLVGQRAGARAEYRYRRILNDPVENFTEHQVVIGLSLFFHNPPTPRSHSLPRD